MPLSSIAQILLRLTSLHWFITGLIQLVITLFPIRHDSFSIPPLAAPSIFLLAGALFWVFAPFLSRQFTRGADSAISLEGVSLASLYSTAFVGLGLWFALGNFAIAINWIHYYISYGSNIEKMTNTGLGSFYNFSQPAMTVVAGVVLVASARIWARKLTKESEPDATPNGSPRGSLSKPHHD